MSFTYTATFPEECEWQNVVHRSYISGNDAKTINTASPEECKKACEDEKDFHCVSFDYYRPSERCYLQRVDLFSSIKLSTHKDYDFYERICYGKLSCLYNLSQLRQYGMWYVYAIELPPWYK